MTTDHSSSVRAWIDWDERYPVFTLVKGEPRRSRLRNIKTHNFPADFVDRYERVIHEFNALQQELRDLSDYNER